MSPVILTGKPSAGLTLVMGQSNCVGQGDPTQVDEMYSRSFARAYLDQNFPSVYTYSGPLIPRPVNHMGIELSFGRALPDRGIIMYGQGSTSLAIDWAPGSSLRTGAVAFAHGIEAREGIPVTSIIWMQGEHDATDSAQSLAYGTNLLALIADMAVEFPYAKFYYYKLPIAETYAANVRYGQYLAQSTNAIMIDVDDIPLTGVHFTSAGLITLGQRFAATIKAAENPADTPITVDATSGWARPANRSEVEKLFAGTAIPMPDGYWPCTELNSDLVDVINGSVPLSAFGSPLYNQTSANYSGGGVGGADNTTDGFQMAAGVGPNPADRSQTWIFVTEIASAPAATRGLGGLNVNAAPAQLRLQLTPSSGTKLRIVVDGVTTTGTVSHATGKHIFGFTYDRANSRVVAYSDVDTVTGTYSSGVASGNKGIFRQNTLGGAICRGVYMWHGAKSENMSDGNIATIMSRIMSPP